MLSRLEEEVQAREAYVLNLFHICVRLITVWYVVFRRSVLPSLQFDSTFPL